MHFKTGYYWSPGLSGTGNQDSLALHQVECKKGEALLAVVCDGIGSLEGSQHASAAIVQDLTDWFYSKGKDLIRDGTKGPYMLMALQKAMTEASNRLVNNSKKAGLKIGTTCSAILMYSGFYYIIHIGDSRIYKISKNNPIKKLTHKTSYSLNCLTIDHVDSQGRLKKALGLSLKERPCFNMGRIRKGDVFVLCTDGFCRGIENELGSILGNYTTVSDEGLSRRLEMLGEQSIKKGSQDNLSAIVVYVLPQGLYRICPRAFFYKI